MNEEKQIEFINSLYDKYGVTDQSKKDYALQAFRQDFDGALSAFYNKYNPEKEIDQEYFGQIKNSFFLQETPTQTQEPNAVYADVNVNQEAPSGFWANLRNGLDNVPEAVANNFWMGLNFVDRSIDNAFDYAIEGITGIPQSGESANTEFFLDKIQKNKDSMSATKGVLDEDATIPERAAGVLNYAIDFTRSIVSGVVSMGALPIVEQSESMYLDALEKQAELEGVNPLSLIVDGKDRELEPLLYGAAAAALEKVGLKGVNKYIGDLDSNVFKWLYTNAKEGSTEWGQDVLSFINEARAKGQTVPEALSEAASRGFSREGAETFVGSFLGSSVVSGAGRQIKKQLNNLVGEESTTETTTPTESQADPSETPKTDAIDAFLSAANTIETGDKDMDSIVNDVVKNAIQDAKSLEIEEKMQSQTPEVATEQTSEVAPAAEGINVESAMEVTPEEKKKQKAEVKLEQAVAQDISRTVKDKESLKKVLYPFFGASPTSQADVEQVNAAASLIDGIIGARAKRDGISKPEWYTSRIASIGVKQEGQEKKAEVKNPKQGAETSFLEDGRAVINALTSSNPRQFIREFGKVLQNDLTDQEALALEAEFGINFKKDTSDESVDQFGQAFESYLETGRVPEGIKGNTANFVKAAFKKMADWLRDVKSSITGEFSTYMTENSKRIFDGIVTGQEIKQEEVGIKDGTEAQVNTNEQSDRLSNETESGVNQKTVVAGEEIIDLTDSQEEVVDTKTNKDEPKTKKIDGKKNVSVDTTKGTKGKASPAERASKAFDSSQKEFKADTPKRREILDRALNSLYEVINDPEQDTVTKTKAQTRANELFEIKQKAERDATILADKEKNISEAKAGAKADGYSTAGITQAVNKAGMAPLGYDNGVFATVNLETGEVETLNLADGSVRKTTVEEYSSEGSKKKREKAERVRKTKRESEANKTKEGQEKAKKEKDKANSVMKSLVDNSPTTKSFIEVVDKMNSIDSEFLDSVSEADDATSDSIAESVSDYFSEMINYLTPTSNTAKHLSSKIKAFNEISEKVFNSIKDNKFISESERTDLLDKFNRLSKLMDQANDSASVAEMNKRKKEALGGRIGTVVDNRKGTGVNVQIEGSTTFVDSVNEVKGDDGKITYNKVESKLSKFISEVYRGFGINKKMVVLDMDYFHKTIHPDFKGKSELEIAELRAKKIDKIAAIMSETDIYVPSESTGRYGKASNDFLSLVNVIREGVESGGPGFILTGSDFSLVPVSLSDNMRDNTIFLHEIGHDLQFEIFHKKTTKEQRDAVRSEFTKWKAKQKQVSFATPTQLAEDGRPGKASKDFFDHNISFNEWFAENTAFWFVTKKEPSTIVEKLFSKFAARLKDLFLTFKGAYGPSKTVSQLLDDHFSFMGNRAEATVVSERNKVSSRSNSVASKLIEYQEIIDGASDETKSKKIVQREGESVQDAVDRYKSPAAVAQRASYRNAVEGIDKLNKELDGLYNEYKELSGLASRESFMAEAMKRGEEMLRKRNYQAAMAGLESTDVKNLSPTEVSSLTKKGKDESTDGDVSDLSPAVTFQKGNKKPVRDIIINKAITFVDGKFSTLIQFDKLMKSFDKALSAAGESKLTAKEKQDILKGTTSASIALIKSPLVKELQKRKRADIKDVITSLDATPQERANALAEIGSMVASTATLSAKDLDKVNRLSLVGINNATQAERTKAIEDGLADAIVKVQKSKVNEEILQTRNKKHVEVDQVALESLQGAKKNADGTYTVKTESGRTITVSVYDINKSYAPGTLVVHLGRVRKITSLKEPSNSLSSKSEAYDTFNRKKTTVEIANQATRSRIANWARNLFIETQGIESLVNIISPQDKKGAFETSLGKMIGEDGFRKASVDKRRQFDEVESKYQKIAMRVFGVSKGAVGKKLMDLKGNTRKIKFRDNNGNTIEKEFPISELMTYYSYLAQKDLVGRFKKMEEDFKSSPQDARFWNKSKQDAIIDSLKKEEKDFVKGIVTELMPFVYEKLNVAHRKNFGYDLQVVENYFPVSVFLNEKDSRSSSEMDLDSVKMADFISSVSSKNIKNRTGGQALRPTDFMSTFLGYADRALHYANYVEPMSKASMLLQNSEYAGFLRGKFGGKVMESIDWALDNISAGRAVNYNRKAYIDMIRNASIGGAFMANLTMIPKQLSSFVTYADKVGYREFIKYYTVGALNIKQKIEDIKGIWSLDFTKDRWKSQGRVSYDTFGLMLDNVEREVRKTNTQRRLEFLHARLTGMLFIPVAIGDIGAVFAGGMPYYNKLKKEAEAKFPSDVKAQKSYIEVKFSEITSRTQQSRDIMDQAKIQTSGSVDSLLTTFMSTPILYGRLLSGGINDLKKGVKNGDKDLIKKGVKTITMFGLIAPAAFQIASSGGGFAAGLLGMGDDEDEQERSFKYLVGLFGVSFFQHIPIVYPLLQNMIDKQILDKTFDAGVAAPLDILTKGADSLNDILTSIKKEEFSFDDPDIQRAINNVLRTVGINYSGVKNIGEAWANFDETIDEDWRLLLGYSPYTLGVERE